MGGKPFPLKLGDDRQARVEAWAAERGIGSRAEAVRQLVDLALAAETRDAAPTVTSSFGAVGNDTQESR
ncbi:hypothetical protein AB0F91_34560 [Amycolatopsis sp. NPDC023774]|uniref:Ribbon-helix-helix protein CopG domain-containing protein n=1 Tax=Amycolatopsis carbonis TaxID=715471 RepID=A0A9Y2MXV1_9PSEU|nr:hypothetical protein [Amycolatopsis sp. 2-15]WIX79212.1 hypothetical protein QRX50_49180 [Amycolatopsis sp. 2-15]